MNRKDAMGLKVRDLDLSVKSVDAKSGRFSGYASVWGEVDSYREIVARGAFTDTLTETKAKGRTLPILWQHRTAEPIGHWTELREDERGLYGEGELWIDEAPYARLARKGFTTGSVTGLSIGFYVQDDSWDETKRLRTLKRLDLREVSIVTDPALEAARIDTIKQKLANGEHLSEREFRRVLRERGFSNSQAEGIAALGFNEWSRRETGTTTANPSGLGDLSKALAGFSLPSF